MSEKGVGLEKRSTKLIELSFSSIKLIFHHIFIGWHMAGTVLGTGSMKMITIDTKFIVLWRSNTQHTLCVVTNSEKYSKSKLQGRVRECNRTI